MVTICTNATAVITLANATTAGSGFHCVVINGAGSGNVSIVGPGNVNGAASINATIGQGYDIDSTGSTWWAH